MNFTQPSTENPTFRRYWPEPPTIPIPNEYIDVNKDPNLRKDVTTFFHNKVLKWLDSESCFHKYKNKKSFLKSIEGQMHIYHLLRKFIKRSGINWYDLRDNYHIIKEYICKKL